MTLRNICEIELNDRIESVKSILESASKCNHDKDFLQCAVRLNELEKIGRFTEFELSVFDAESKEAQ